ncbi:unnamed protein product [Lactuca virosa]|uniref:Uncharacterized protein n=1 Tax=Lactuca virosa TaxID=75947 RepID=A0AAU9PUW4_9ASTR|nr:unnamed protein product [Lactuca virosa]
MANHGRRNQPEGHPDFPWYTFSRVVSPKVLAQWNGKLSWMKERKVHVPAEVNWFVCMAWRRFFHIQDVVYKELVVEFLATVTFRRQIGIHEPKNITFCLGREVQAELNRV